MEKKASAAPNDKGRPAESQSVVGRSVRDLAWYVPAQAATSLLTLASMATLTRLLEPEHYGWYTLTISACSMVSQLAFGWLQQSGLRFWGRAAAAGEEERSEFLSAIIALFCLSGAASAIGWPFLLPTLLPGVPRSITVIAFIFLLSQGTVSLIQVRTRATRDLRWYALYSVFAPFSLLAIGSALVMVFWRDATAPLLAIITANVAVVAIDLLRDRRGLVPSRFSPTRDQLRKLSAFGLPMLTTTVGALVLDMSDRFLIVRTSGIDAAALYSIAYNLAFRLDVLTLALISAAFPLLVREYERAGGPAAGSELSRLLTIYCSLVAPAVVGFTLVAEPLTTVFLGEKFRPAWRFILPLAPGVFFVGVHHYVVKPFSLVGNTRPGIVIATGAAALNLSANLILLPRFGPMAAAWTTSACLFIMTAWTYAWSRKLLPYRLDWSGMTRILIGTAAMAGAVLLIPPLASPSLLLALRIVVGAFTYFVAAIVLDVVGFRRFARIVVARMIR